jgi:hypothetical protein
MSSRFACAVCERQFDTASEHWHRACGHHTCAACAVPLIRGGKVFCVRCPVPKLPSANLEGNLVLGGTSEQNERVALLLRQERRKVCPQGAWARVRTRSPSHCACARAQ